DRRGEAETVAEDLAPGDRVAGDRHLGVVEPLQDVHARVPSDGARWASRASSWRATYLPITSTSRLTGSPGSRKPSVVRCRVSGIRLTVNESSLASTT